MSKLQKFYGHLMDVLIYGSLASLVWLFSDFVVNHQINCNFSNSNSCYTVSNGEIVSRLIRNPSYHFSWLWLALAISAIAVGLYAKVTKKVQSPYESDSDSIFSNILFAIGAISAVSLIFCGIGLFTAWFGDSSQWNWDALTGYVLVAIGWLALLCLYAMVTVDHLPLHPEPEPPTIAQKYLHYTDEELVVKRDEINTEILRRKQQHSTGVAVLGEALSST